MALPHMARRAGGGRRAPRIGGPSPAGVGVEATQPPRSVFHAENREWNMLGGVWMALASRASCLAAASAVGRCPPAPRPRPKVIPDCHFAVHLSHLIPGFLLYSVAGFS